MRDRNITLKMVLQSNLCAVLVFAILFVKTISALCVSNTFEHCFDSDGKKPTSGIEVETEVDSREACLGVCIAARYPQTVFYNNVTMRCYCTKDAVLSLGLTEDTGGMCMEIMGYIETWITSILRVSSEYRYSSSDTRYLASQIIGAPDVYPNTGDLAGTWCANAVDDNQWIEVAIPEALYIYHVYIYETFHPGGLKTLSVKDTSNNWHVLWSSPQIQALPKSRIFDPLFQTPTFKVNGFRLDVVMSVAGNWVQYDAIQVVGRT